MDSGGSRGGERIVGHGPLTLSVRLIVACAVAGALVAGGVALARADRTYRAHAYVIRVPPRYEGDKGLAFARARLVPGAQVEHTGRGDFAITAHGDSAAEAMERATDSAKAIKRSIAPQPGLGTVGRGAHVARRQLGAPGWALLGALIGFWIGAALAIVRRGSARAPRRASAPYAPG
jgi:hypothetical protein